MDGKLNMSPFLCGYYNERIKRSLSCNKFSLKKLLLIPVKNVKIAIILLLWGRYINMYLQDTLLIKKKSLLNLSLDKVI